MIVEVLEQLVELTQLFGADLAGADVDVSRLSGADLRIAGLRGTNFWATHREGARLGRAWLDAQTKLNEVRLDMRTRLGDVQWDGVGSVNLTQIDWRKVPILGDEQRLAPVQTVDGKTARRLATQLRAQGMSEVADRFAERAQIHVRKYAFRLLTIDWRRPWRLPNDFSRWLFSWFLALLAGYGYRLWRILVAYVVVIAIFAVLYSIPGLARHGLSADLVSTHALDAFLRNVQISLNAIHGRVFFAQFGLDTAQSRIATAESVVGIVIEGVFVAVLIQRLFSR